MVNKNTKNGVISNFIGGLMVIAPMIIFTAQYFLELKKEAENLHLGIVAFVGLVVLLGYHKLLFTVVINWLKNRFPAK